MQKEPMEAILEKVDACPICNSNESCLIHQGLSDRMMPDHERKWNLFRCDKCHHGWLNPRYSKEAIHLAYKGYSDNIWPENEAFSKSPLKQKIKNAYYMSKYGYETNVNLWDKLFSRLVTLLVPDLADKFDRQIRYLSIQNRGCLLDVGSGSGWFLENMQRLGWNVRGVDIDEVSAEKVRKRGILVDLGFLEDQSYANESFDVVTMAHVIEHLHDPVGTLKESLRILKPGGKLILLTPNMESYGYALFQSDWLHLDPPRHLNIFCLRSIRLAAKTAGFIVDKLVTNDNFRLTSDTWMKSNEIKKTGKFSRNNNRSLTTKLSAMRFGIREKTTGVLSNKVGEEILIICHKSIKD